MSQRILTFLVAATCLAFTSGTSVKVSLSPFKSPRSLHNSPSYELKIQSEEGDSLKTLYIHPSKTEVFQTGLHYVELGPDGARNLSPDNHQLRAIQDKLYSDGKSSLLISNDKVSGILDSEHSIRHSPEGHHTLHSLAPVPEPEDFNDSIDLDLNYTEMIGGLSDDAIKVEVWVVLDYDFGKQFDFNREKILNYLGPFFHGINTRYASVSEWDVQMLVAGITVVTDRAQQPWLENNKLEPDWYDISKTLEDISIAVHDGKLPKADLVALIANSEMASPGRPSVAGMAFAGTPCRTQKIPGKGKEAFVGTSVTEDRYGAYLGVHAVAHELGHNMGAPHDGKSPNTMACPWDDGYVMAYPLTKNHFHFSTCSIELIGKVINSKQASCIRERKIDSPAIEDPNSKDLPGVVITRDEMCRKMTKNPKAHAIFDKTKPTDYQCQVLDCYGGDHKDMAPEEGSPCGTGGICKSGKCVEESG